jgi:hypothetical protein
MEYKIMTHGCFDMASSIEEAKAKIEAISGEKVILSNVWEKSQRYPGEERMAARFNGNFLSTMRGAGIYRRGIA